MATRPSAFDEEGVPRGWNEPPAPPPRTPPPAPSGDDDDEWVPPKRITARELSDLDLPTTRPILGAETRGPLLVPGQRVVLGAQSGAGKTTMCLHMVAAHCSKGRFLEWEGFGGRAAYVDLEQGLRSAQRRLREVGLDESDDLDYFRIPDGMSLDRSPRQRQWFADAMADGGYDIVVIDPLYKLHRCEGDEREMVDLLRFLDKLRDELNFCLLLPAHLRKADKTGRSQVTMDDISGRGAIVYGAEVVIGLQLLAGLPESGEGWGKSRLHFWKDRDGDLPVGQKWNLSFHPERGYIIDDRIVKTTAELVTEYLARMHPEPVTVADIAKAIEKSEKTVSRAIKTIRDGGIEVAEVVVANGRKGYRLAEVYDGEVDDGGGWEA